MRAGRLEEAAAAFSEVVRLDPAFAQAYFNLALARMQQDEQKEASLWSRTASSSSPLFAAPIYSWACRMGAYDSAESAFKTELKLDPANSDAWMWLGVAQRAQGNPLAAVASLGKTAALNDLMSKRSCEHRFDAGPRPWRAHRVLAQSYTDADRLNEASSRYYKDLQTADIRSLTAMKRRIEILASIFARKARKPLFLYLLFPCFAVSVSAQTNEFAAAMHSFQLRQWADAAALFQNIETAYPGQTDALLYLGKSFVNLNRYPEADAALEKYSSAHQASAEALYLLAYVRFRENRPKDSLELSTAAARIQAPGADDLKIVALDYVLFEDLNNAARYLRESIAIKPEDVESRYSLGRVLYQQNHFDDAESEFREVLRLQPRHVKAMDNLGLVAEGKNDPSQAVLAYKKAIEADAQMITHSEQPYLNLGILLTRLGRPEEAEPWLQKAIKIRPDYAKAHLSLGKTYLAMGRFSSSQNELATAVRLQPDDSAAHYFLGRAYYRGGDKVQAAKEFALAENLMKHQQGSATGMGNSGVSRID